MSTAPATLIASANASRWGTWDVPDNLPGFDAGSVLAGCGRGYQATCKLTGRPRHTVPCSCSCHVSSSIRRATLRSLPLGAAASFGAGTNTRGAPCAGTCGFCGASSLYSTTASSQRRTQSSATPQGSQTPRSRSFPAASSVRPRPTTSRAAPASPTCIRVLGTCARLGRLVQGTHPRAFRLRLPLTRARARRRGYPRVQVRAGRCVAQLHRCRGLRRAPWPERGRHTFTYARIPAHAPAAANAPRGPCHPRSDPALARRAILWPYHDTRRPLSLNASLSLSPSLSLSLGRGAGCWLATGRWVSAPRASAARTRCSGERRPARHAHLVRLCPRRQVSEKRLECYDPAPAAELSGRGGCGAGQAGGRAAGLAWSVAVGR